MNKALLPLLMMLLLAAAPSRNHAQSIGGTVFYVPGEIFSEQEILGELEGFGHSVYESGMGLRLSATTSRRNAFLVGGELTYMHFASEDYGNRRIDPGHYLLLSPKVGLSMRIIHFSAAFDFGLESLGSLTTYERILTPEGRYRMLENDQGKRNNVTLGGHLTGGFTVPFADNTYNLNLDFTAYYLRSNASENLFWTVGVGFTWNRPK